MLLPEMLDNIRIELRDTDPDSYIHEPDDLVRAIAKSVSLMSRLSPKIGMVETTIVLSITSETLTISSNTGTLAYKPIKSGSLTIPNKTLDTHYRINYLTGVVTEIGSGLPDADYTVSYELDPQMLDISSLLPDYIKIERMEYPVGDTPAAYPPFDVFQDLIVLRGTDLFTENYHSALSIGGNGHLLHPRLRETILPT